MSPALADPQQDVDVEIERHRPDGASAVTWPLRQAWAVRFEHCALAAQGTALKRRTVNDAFGARLAEARAEVYALAARLVRDGEVVDADLAQFLMHKAAERHVGRAQAQPLKGYDDHTLLYIQARAWQWCAQQIDPALPEVQVRWE